MIKKTILFMMAIPLLAILSIGNVTLTKCSDAVPQIVDVYVQGYENQKYTSQDFTAFVNSTVVYKVVSDVSLNAYNYDGAEISIQEDMNNQNTYTVTIVSDKSLNTQLVLQNDAGCTFSNINFIDNIDELKILAPNIVNKNNDNTFKILYNGNDKLKFNGQVEYTLTLDGVSQTLQENNALVTSLNANEVVLNFSDLTESDIEAKLSIKVEDVEACFEFKIENLPLTDIFMLQSYEVSYMPNTTQVVVNAYVTKNSFAQFNLLNDYAKITNIEYYSQNENYDEYLLTIDISEMISKDSITLSVITSGGEIIRGVHLTEITSITNFTITSEKLHYNSDETIKVSAMINNEESLSGDIVWYVNGIKFSTGSTLSITRSEGGNFSVYAMFGEVQSNTLNFTVSYQGTELIIWYVIFILALLILIGLVIFKKKKKHFYMSASLIERARKIVPRYNTYINDYNKRQFKDLLYDVAVLKDDTYQNFNDTKDFCFERASRALGVVKNTLQKIYKSNAEDRKTLLIENSKIVEDNVNLVINAYEEFSKAYPNEKIFTFNKKQKLKQKENENKNESK